MPSLYTSLLFIHIVAASLLFVAEGITYVALRELRAASSSESARLAFSRAQTVKGLGKAMPIVLLLSALGLCALAWGFAIPWVTLSLFGFVGIALLVQFVDHPRLNRIGALLGTDVSFDQLRPALSDPVLRRAVRARLGLLVWLVFLMTLKPALVLGVGVLVLLTVGALIFPAKREERLASLTP